jgi:regulator of protease activity HflC (stomatin/prohibitin superfamily)
MFDKLVEIVIQFAELFKFWVVMNPYEAGVKLRLGKYVNNLDPGFNWMIPFGIDQYEHEHIVPRTHSLPAQSVTLADGKQVGFEAVITYKVRDIEVALLQVENSDHAIQDSCAGQIAHTIMQCTWSELVESEDWNDRVLKACRQRGFKFGLEITNVQFSTLALMKNLRLLK